MQVAPKTAPDPWAGDELSPVPFFRAVLLAVGLGSLVWILLALGGLFFYSTWLA
jgi:hypothetical protein